MGSGINMPAVSFLQLTVSCQWTLFLFDASKGPILTPYPLLFCAERCLSLFFLLVCAKVSLLQNNSIFQKNKIIFNIKILQQKYHISEPLAMILLLCYVFQKIVP